jgi:hypothetical protein
MLEGFISRQAVVDMLLDLRNKADNLQLQDDTDYFQLLIDNNLKEIT